MKKLIIFETNGKRFDSYEEALKYEKLCKKVDGIIEVRDESDKDSNIRIVIDLKSGADKNLVLNYLLKNTDLQFFLLIF